MKTTEISHKESQKLPEWMNHRKAVLCFCASYKRLKLSI